MAIYRGVCRVSANSRVLGGNSVKTPHDIEYVRDHSRNKLFKSSSDLIPKAETENRIIFYRVKSRDAIYKVFP